MRTAAFLLLAAISAPSHVVAQCAGAEAPLREVARALASEDIAKADPILDKLQKSVPDCPELILDRGRSLYLKGDTTSAESEFNRYIQLAPDDARGYAHLARLLLDQRQYPRADSNSALAVEKNPAEPEALAIRGQILAMKGQTAAGESLLEQALQLDPDHPEANYQLAVLYDQSKHHQEAVKLLEKSVAALPGNTRAWDYLALNLEPLGEEDRADEAYRKGEAVNQPGRHYDGFIYYNYGRFLAKRNQFKEAKERLDRAVEAAPRVRAVWYERAKLNFSLKNYTGARDDAEKARALPDQRGVILDLQVYALLGKIHARLGNKDLADKYDALSRTTPVPVKESR